MEPSTIMGALRIGIGPAAKIWHLVRGRFEGLDIEVRSLSFRDVREWKSIFAVITRNPVSYSGTFQISNGTAQRRGIKKAELLIDGKSFAWDEADVEPFSSGDVRTVQWVFPIADDAPRGGPFVLCVTDSTGKVKKIVGLLDNKSS